MVKNQRNNRQDHENMFNLFIHKMNAKANRGLKKARNFHLCYQGADGEKQFPVVKFAPIIREDSV